MPSDVQAFGPRGEVAKEPISPVPSALGDREVVKDIHFVRSQASLGEDDERRTERALLVQGTVPSDNRPKHFAPRPLAGHIGLPDSCR